MKGGLEFFMSVDRRLMVNMFSPESTDAYIPNLHGIHSS